MGLGYKSLVLAQGVDALERSWIFGVADDQQVVVIPQHVEHHLNPGTDQLHLLAQPGPLKFIDSRLAFGGKDARRTGSKANHSHELHGKAQAQFSKKTRKNLPETLTRMPC